MSDPTMPGSETQEQASPYAIREELVDIVVGDLLGPANGPDEELIGLRPTDRYVVGQLAPRGSLIEPEEQDELVKAGDTSNDDGEAESGTPEAESLRPSSLGLTFTVDGAASSILVRASWGEYVRTPSETLLTDAGQPRLVWKRFQAGGERAVELVEGPVEFAPDGSRDQVVVQGQGRRADDGNWVVTLFLVNGQESQERLKDEAFLFQPEIEVRAVDGLAIFRRRPERRRTDESGLFDTFEQGAMDMTYRHVVEFAVGHGAGVHVERSVDAPDRAVCVRTAVIPRYDVPMTESATIADYSDSYPEFADLVLDMKELSELESDELLATLSALASSYKAWIERNVQRIDSPEPDLAPHLDAAKNARERWEHALQRLEEGIGEIAHNPDAAESFRLANRAMWLQRVRSEYVRARMRGEDPNWPAIDVPENRSWYPFQLAFILISLPSATSLTHPDRVEPLRAVADLLWFPTGGGKTEAYLGLAAYVMVLRRLQGEVGDRDGTHGVAVIMRYTLRLLTIQQFQRASALMCALEYLRREEFERGEQRLGDEPFRIGLWVGRRATPNTTEQSGEAIREAHGDVWQGGFGSGTPAQLTSCPWCGAEIKPGRDISVVPHVDRTLIFCSDVKGSCPFSRRQAPSEGLPVVVVDEEIYRLLPALVIATVDKFAQMPWKGEVQTLFGRVSGLCLRHGFCTPEGPCTGRHPRRGKLPAVMPEEARMLRPPDLIIQDELHLISGPLGSLAGLYETAIDDLCSWEYEAHMVRPKVIASTATIRNAREQVHGLFLRQVEIFPPHGLDAPDDFFGLQRDPSEEKPGRRYIGICAPGRDRPAVLIRVYVALLCAAQKLFQRYGQAADPWMTLVGYFNSIRELGGMRRLVEDDVRTRAFRAEMSEMERPGLSQRQIRSVEELTSRRSSIDIPRVLERLERPFVASTREGQAGAIDVLLATNMVSVGVDVRRLGLMVVAGQPKTTAEYIQATSRIGRAWPGLVCTVLNWARPRDLSHYETFEHFHATYHKQVEALSLTPFAARAIDRGLTGVLASLVRLDDLAYNPNESAGKLDRSDPAVDEHVRTIVDRGWHVTDEALVRDLLQQTLEQRLDDWAHEAEKPDRTLGYVGRRDGSTIGLLKSPGAGSWDPFAALNSLRDVEPNAPLILVNPTSGAQLPAWAAPNLEDSEGEP